MRSLDAIAWSASASADVPPRTSSSPGKFAVSAPTPTPTATTTRQRYPVSGNPYRIRDPHAPSLTEIWIVSAIVTIIAIRGFLYVTGYPQVGGDSFHIAHMLWGGLGMVIGFGMLILFAHFVWKPIAAVVAGAGFGAFIDELGKFITKDNDYFYQPTIGLIYAIFIVLLLLARLIDRRRKPTAADHLYVAVQGIQWQAIGKLDKERQQNALEHLDASETRTPLTAALREILESAELVEYGEQSRILLWRERLVARYWKIVGNHWMERIVIGVFILKGIQILGTLLLGISDDDFTIGNGFSFSEWGAVISATVSGALATYGLVRLAQRARIAALHAFAGATLVSLLFGQFFAFASEQFAAIGGLIIELAILGGVRFALAAERAKRAERAEATHRERGVDPTTGIGQYL